MGNEAAAPLRLSDDDAIDLGHVDDLSRLLRAIDEAMPGGAVLYVEGTSIAPAIADWFRQHELDEKPAIAPNTLWPRPRTFHLPLTGGNLAKLRSLAEEYAEPEVAEHLVVYRDGEVLLWAPDAGNEHVMLRRSLPQDAIERFRAALE
jgi:hypothetical protein